MRYRPELVLSVGTAGALSPDLSRGDLVAVRSASQHDLQGGGFVYAPEIQCAEPHLSRLAEIAGRAGGIITGDTFVSDDVQKNELQRKFGADLCDMETAAAGMAATLAGVPFAGLRAVSDGANIDAHASFWDVIALCAEKLEDALLRFLAEG